MSVIKNMRNLSSMEFYKKAIDLRKEITIWLLKDFGYKRNARSVKRVIKDISEEDKKTIDDIFIKYGKNVNKEYESVYPEWFVEDERKIIMEILQSMMINITKANSIYVTNTLEYETRRMYQDKAIGDCYCLYHEIQYITTIFPTNLNNLVFLLDDIEREIDLLRGWRASDKSKYNSHKTLYHMDNLFNQLFKEELRMKNAKVLSQKEVKDILAEHFGVKPEDVISTKYSYIITESEDSKDGRENIHD